MKLKLRLLLVLAIFSICTTLIHPISRRSFGPYNAIEFFYKKIKKLRYRDLLPYLAGTEKLRLQKVVLRMYSNHKIFWALKKQSDKLSGYKIYRYDVFKKVALIHYAWITTVLKPNPKNRRFKLKKKHYEHFQALLYKKKDGLWYIVATHAKMPKAEKNVYQNNLKKKRAKKNKKR